MYLKSGALILLFGVLIETKNKERPESGRSIMIITSTASFS